MEHAHRFASPWRRSVGLVGRAIEAAILAAVLLLPRRAWAGPSTGVERFGENALEFLSGTLGPIVLGIGLALAAYSLIFGSRDGLQKVVGVIVAGVLLFSVESVVSFISAATR